MNELYKSILDIKYLPKFFGIIIIIGINWTFQSLLYMDKTEKVFKILLELVLFVIFFILLLQVLSTVFAVLISLIIAHTINWIFNGHFFALLKTFGMVKTKKATFLQYLDYLKENSSKEDSIILVATFGSLSREELNETSDLDIRIIRKKGGINGLKACIFLMNERSKSFFNKFPLDIYLLDNINQMEQLKEEPIIIYSNGNSILWRNNY